MFSNDLDCTNSRGVLIYVDKCLDCSEITIGSKFCENVFIRINQDLVIGNIYRSPNSSQENDMELCDLIGVLSKKYAKFLLVGDFNFSDIDWTNIMRHKASKASLICRTEPANQESKTSSET